MAAVENLCQRGIVLEHGQVVFDGDTKGAVAKYLAQTNRVGEGGGHEVDLVEAPTRKPQYSPVITKLELFTNDGEPAPRAVRVGARLTLKLHLDLPDEVPNFRCGVGFNSIFGQRVLTLMTSLSPDLKEPSGKTVLVCDVPSLTLVPGEYFVFLYVDYGNDRKDALPEAVMLSVQDADYYGTGKVPLMGVVVMPHSWKAEGSV